MRQMISIVKYSFKITKSFVNFGGDIFCFVTNCEPGVQKLRIPQTLHFYFLSMQDNKYKCDECKIYLKNGECINLYIFISYPCKIINISVMDARHSWNTFSLDFIMLASEMLSWETTMNVRNKMKLMVNILEISL